MLIFMNALLLSFIEFRERLNKIVTILSHENYYPKIKVKKHIDENFNIL